MPSLRTFLSLPLLAIAFALLAGFASAKLTVVNTNTLLADFTRVIGADDIDSRCLLTAGTDPHSYDPTPADVRLLASADLVIVNGLGFETWIDNLIANSGYHGPVLLATKGIKPLALSDTEDHSTHDHAAHDHATHGDDFDPHAWHDLRHARRYVENIRDALIALAPTHADAFRSRANAYLAELDALDTLARAQFSAIPEPQRKLVTSHDALRYLAHAYGLTIIPISGLRPDQEPTAKQLAAIVKLIRREKVRALFIESTSNPKIPTLLAREAGVTVVSELYTDSLGAPGTPGATFLGMARHNLETITTALR